MEESELSINLTALTRSSTSSTAGLKRPTSPSVIASFDELFAQSSIIICKLKQINFDQNRSQDSWLFMFSTPIDSSP